MSHFIIELDEGVVIMLIGMGVVFIFLCVMVWVMGIMSKVVMYLNTIFPEQANVTDKPSKKSAVSRIDDMVVVAIAAAIKRKRA